MPDAVGWAVIDYIKNGRPKYFESDIVFLKHMPPFDPISDNDHLEQRIVFHMNKAGMPAMVLWEDPYASLMRSYVHASFSGF